ncbi:MAG: hypothetical protein JW860_00845 [Sedimentisphaerales bacterium]|nr:hypothetical protein [Sedimentisphaerales bacterium]
MNSNRTLLAMIILLAMSQDMVMAGSEQVTIVLTSDASPRVRFGAERLQTALTQVGYNTSVVSPSAQLKEAMQIIISSAKPPRGQDSQTSEGYHLKRQGKRVYRVTGFGESGMLYGCLELAERITEAGVLPAELDLVESPAFKLRGPCIGMQLTSLLPGRDTYEYPITPENFPFFYDRQHWIEYLDMLVENRMNTLYLWNGHPFASLVKLEDYPYALEVSEEDYQRNVEMYRTLTEEADKRGIWVIQMFYNIFVSQPFAAYHGIETQHRAPTPLISDYNRKSITRFMEMYPNVGLLVCLGEALSGQENQEAWMNETVIGGVKDAMKKLGKTEEPPIVVRAHAVGNVKHMVESALRHYTNLYTMAKYNGESLTTYEPRGQWQQVHLDMSRLGSMHVVNVHLLSNLEPFRYGATEFIRKSVLACRDRLGARGLHLYPLAYWDWPNTPDSTDPYMVQYERDWIWFDAWARYLWQPDRDPETDCEYWVKRLTERYGNNQAAKLILSAYNDAGFCAPLLLRRLGITEGNRQTFSLGMFLDQLVNPEPYQPFDGLWKWQAPPGERLREYAKKEWLGQAHEGETPVTVIEAASRYADQAVAAIDKAAPLVTKNREEFERLRNDMQCIRLVSDNYAEKVRAALLVLRYTYSRDTQDMHQAAVHLERSLEIYRALAQRTATTYRYANTLQTGHRRIPIRGWKDNQPAYYHWQQMLPLYEEELVSFKQRLQDLDREEPIQRSLPGPRLKDLPFELLSPHAQTYELKIGAKPFMDRDYAVLQLADELTGLTGIRFSHTAAKAGKLAPIRFKTEAPAKVLIGYFNEDRNLWAKPPNLDIDSQAARYGGVETVMQNIMQLEGSPGVNLHVFTFDAGEITFDPRGPGSYLILGVVPADDQVTSRDVGLSPGRR